MKKLFYFFAVMMLFSMTACTKEEPVDPVEPTPVEITVSKESILVNKGGTSKAISVDVTYEGEWKFTVSSAGKDWCTVTRAINSNRLSITVKANLEENAKARQTTISVFAADDSSIKKTINIKQAGPKDGLVIDKTTYTVEPKDSILSIDMLANVEYDITVEKDQEWFKLVDCIEDEDTGKHTLQFSIEKNPYQSTRKATTTIVSETKEEVKFTVTQNEGGIIVAKKVFQAPSKQSKSYEVEIEAYAEIADIKTEDGKDWIQFLECVDVEDSYNKILKFSIAKNTEDSERQMVVTIVSETDEETSFTIQQRGKDSVSNAEDVGGDVVVTVDNITSTTVGSYGNTVPENLIDGDLESYYSAAGTIRDMPVSLTCYFNTAERIDYVDIVPGRVYGKWGETDVYVTTAENPEEVLYGSYDFKKSTEKQRVVFQDGLANPRSVRFEIKTADMWIAGDGVTSPTLIAAHEITFYSINPEALDMLKFFTDNSYSELKPEVTEDDIDAIPNEFFRNLASDIYSGNYDLKYRAATYKPYPHPDVDMKRFRTSNYSLNDNVTGLYFEAGEHVVFVEETYGIPISLRVIDYQPFDHMAPDSPGWCNEDGHYYPLIKGLNKLNIERRGLVYVMYHTEDSKAKPIKINFPTALVNKYYDLENEPDVDWGKMLREAKADHIDMKGKKSIFTLPVEWIEHWCGTADKAKAVIEQADSIIFLQEQIQGHHKYNTGGHRNRMLYSSTMAKAFMFAGAYRTGYSLRYGTPGKKNPLYQDGTVNMLLNPKKFRVDGWGAYHEVGHCNQLPGFKWTGMAEVTNNFTAMYCAHFFIKDDYPKHKSDYMLLMTGSWYDDRGKYHETSNRYDAAWQCFNDGGRKHAFSGYVGGDPPGEAGPGIDPFFRIVPFWQLYLYNTLVLGNEDFYPDVYHWCRTGNLPDGSPNVVAPEVEVVYDSKTMTGGEQGKTYRMSNDGERQMNFIRLCCDAAQLDLTEFFEQWGLMTPFYGVVVDYGDHVLRITKEMVDEVYEYASQYPKPSHQNIWFINNYNLDKYRNGDGSDVTGFNIDPTIDTYDGRYINEYNGMK